MTFRADEAARVGHEQVEAYFIPWGLHTDPALKAYSKSVLKEVIDELGSVVSNYPVWHPLVCCNKELGEYPIITRPSNDHGYKGLDHTRFFVNGFITCPYYGNGQEVLDSIAALPRHPAATITAEKLNVQFYNKGTMSILVKCNWGRSLNADGTIPLSVALPLLLEKELPYWLRAECAETWETMRPYFLGGPHGSRSSLFLNQEAGQSIKKIWNDLIGTGMFGPIAV